ncbi:MAG: hypothetical protein QW098_06770 [Candidatus Hadarchaeales archaeon]
MRQLLNGNEAAALAAKLARVQVVSAYPITPQTVVVETLAKYVADGELEAEFVKVESEHSALSVCLGASATGARAFTATSSQGLMLMSEILYVVSGMRLPVVMANANRSLSAPLSIWNDQQDSLAVRDSGWIQLYCENNQEILDLLLQAFRLSELLSLPTMVCYDGYILSHTSEAVEVPEQAEVDSFLPPYSPPLKLDPGRPLTLGPVGVPEVYTEARYMQHRDMRRAKEEFVRVAEEFGKRFGRRYGILEEYRTEGAEVLLFTMGSLAGTAKEVVDRCRERGERVGLVKLTLYRPFPDREVVEALAGARVVGVLEKDISTGWMGALYTDTVAAFANEGRRPLFQDFILGLGSRDVTAEDLEGIVRTLRREAEEGRVGENPTWVGLKREMVE